MKKMTYLLNLTLLVVCTQFVFAAPDWDYNPGDYEFTAWVNANVLHDGAQIADDGDILAAFDASGTVRGVGVQVIPNGGSYDGVTLFEITMGSNADGDEISFQYYDASEDAVLGIGETLSFQTNEQFGTLFDALIFNTAAPDYSCPECDDSCVDGGIFGGSRPCTQAFGMGGTCEAGLFGESMMDACPLSCNNCPDPCPVEDECGVCDGDGTSCADDGADDGGEVDFTISFADGTVALYDLYLEDGLVEDAGMIKYEVDSATITLSDGTTINASAECRTHGSGAILWDGIMLTSNVYDADCNEFALYRIHRWQSSVRRLLKDHLQRNR